MDQQVYHRGSNGGSGGDEMVINFCLYLWSSYADLNDAAIPGADEDKHGGEMQPLISFWVLGKPVSQTVIIA